MLGFVYPNEVHVQWDLLIVLYPYITGLVAGAFIISAIYYAFGIKRFKAVARLSLLTALAFLLVCPIPLLIHAGRPERSLETLWTPNISSAMAMFGFIWSSYLAITVIETWLVFRPDIVGRAQSSHGVKKAIYWLLALGVYDLSERSLRNDESIIKWLAFIAILPAFLLPGYIGFIFTGVKANPWWSSELTVVLFLSAAMAAGAALVFLLYLLVGRLTKMETDPEARHMLGNFMLYFVTTSLILEGLGIAFLAYVQHESWEILSRLLTERLWFIYFVIQLILGGSIPFIALTTMALGHFSERVRNMVTVGVSFLIMAGFFGVIWNVVIGGQLYSRSLRGLISYSQPITGVEGLLTGILLIVLPFALFSVLVYLLPPRPEKVPEVTIAHD